MNRMPQMAPMKSGKTNITKDLIDELKRAAEQRAAAGIKGTRQVFRDDKAAGLLLRVNADGSMAWYFDYRSPTLGRTTYKVGDASRMDPGAARKALKALGPDPAADRREQKATLAERKAEEVKAANRTLRKFVEGDYWDRHLKLAPSGTDTKKRILAAWKPLLDEDMEALTVDAVIKHRTARLDAGVNARTLNRDRIALMAALNKATAWGLLSKNPIDTPAFKPIAAAVVAIEGDEDEPDDTATDDGKRVRWLGQRDEIEDVRDAQGNKVGERQRFMDAVADKATPSYLRDLCIVAMNTGLRRGELFKLQWSKVSIGSAMLTVAAATSRKSKKARHIALNAVVLDVLKRLSAEREEAIRQAAAAGEPIKLSPYVFVNPETGKPFMTLKKSWLGWKDRKGAVRGGLVARAQLTDFTFHDLRHDFASRLVQAGVNLYEVKELLGHSSITLTERYAHLAPHHKRAAVAVLEG